MAADAPAHAHAHANANAHAHATQATTSAESLKPTRNERAVDVAES